MSKYRKGDLVAYRPGKGDEEECEVIEEMDGRELLPDGTDGEALVTVRLGDGTLYTTRESDYEPRESIEPTRVRWRGGNRPRKGGGRP